MTELWKGPEKEILFFELPYECSDVCKDFVVSKGIAGCTKFNKGTIPPDVYDIQKLEKNQTGQKNKIRQIVFRESFIFYTNDESLSRVRRV